MATNGKELIRLDHVLDQYIKIGVPWPEIAATLGEWLSARQTVQALQVVGTALVYRGSRDNLALLKKYNGPREAASDDIGSNTEFAVRRRALH
jgi:hypothetical protein